MKESWQLPVQEAVSHRRLAITGKAQTWMAVSRLNGGLPVTRNECVSQWLELRVGRWEGPHPDRGRAEKLSSK